MQLLNQIRFNSLNHKEICNKNNNNKIFKKVMQIGTLSTNKINNINCSKRNNKNTLLIKILKKMKRAKES